MATTELPDGRMYETYTNEAERNSRYNELKRQWVSKLEYWQYKAVHWMIYFITYRN